MFIKPRVLFDSAGGAGGDGTGEGQGTGDGDPKPPDVVTTQDKRFTQEHVDKIVADRLRRERAKIEGNIPEQVQGAIAQWREEHGLDDDAIKRLDTADEKDKELRSAKADATRSKNDFQKLHDKHTRMMDVLRMERVQGEVFRAEGGRSLDRELLYRAIEGRLRFDEDSLSVAVLDEGGELAPEITVKDLVDKTLTDKAFLAAPTGAPGAGSRVGAPRSAEADKPEFDHTKREHRLALLRDAIK